MKSKWKIITVLLLIVIIGGIVGFFLYKKNNTTNIPENYIAVFHGGVGERTYETYIYKIENGHDNYGFRYINVISTTESWGSPNWNHEITGKGSFDWTDSAFTIAKKHGAYSYVTRPNDNQTYTIEEFQKMFLMD